MKPHQLKTLRENHNISLIELAANIGLPSDYIRQIEDEEVIPLEHDLDRMEKGIKNIVKQNQTPDCN